MTVQSAALVADLKALVLRLEDDLRVRVETLPEVKAAWQTEHRRAAAADRTASTWTAWRDDRVTQAAVAWVLTTVFVRFCEDNALLRPVWIVGPGGRRQEALDAEAAYFRAHPTETHREWLLQAVDYLAQTPATANLVDAHSPLWSVSPSGQAATELLDFWRERGAEGELVRSFADPGLSTRFLGDLYQDLSEHAKKTYALLQTPEFVEEFILDRTLEPALAERPLKGFKLIDPACGSGHFLLGAFARLLDRWQRQAPGLEPRVRVQQALDAIWGVDINPFAVAIARFRLLLAGFAEVGARSLEGVPRFNVHVLAGDSLYFSHDQDVLFTTKDDFAYSGEDKDGLIAALTRGQYDAVVANPPYITVKDPKLNVAYRERYNCCRGKYELTAPFMELLFKLAKPQVGDQPAGWVGQITSNAFMKREFGVPMIEDLLAHMDLKLVVDTSGAYIPGHGTPTAILVGRHTDWSSDNVRIVRGIRGEPARPEDPSKGLVWSAILKNHDNTGYADVWISVDDTPRRSLRQHPWSLTGGGAPRTLAALDSNRAASLGAVVDSIGFTAITGDDEFLITSRSHAKRLGSAPIRYVLGEEVRDYLLWAGDVSLVPQSMNGEPVEASVPVLHHFWRGRSTLARRQYFGRSPAERGLRWFDYAIYFPARLSSPFRIAFAFVATHNHFVLARAGRVFKQSAPVVNLGNEASEDDHLKLLGVLNSSTACFWLKQNSHNKGDSTDSAGARVTGDPAFDTYEFTGTTLKDFPLPRVLPLDYGRVLDALGQELSAQQVSSLIASASPTAHLVRSAEAAQASLKRRMIAQQEELDWETYRLYGLVEDGFTYPGESPEVILGERAFEIALARQVAAGGEDTAWFDRHGSTPITEIPAHWPADYRALVQRRLDEIEANPSIRLLERPEYKRRWASEPFARQADAALRDWLLDRLEDRSLWFSRQGHPTPRSVAQLADELGRDAEFAGVVELWKGKGVRLVDALGELLESEAVPYLAAYRLKDSGLRKFEAWQQTWELQRQEDALRPAEDAPEEEKIAANARADKFAATIPVPPKYTSTDFRKQSYWSARGKLDVPKERFIAYPDAGRATDPTALLGWAGWDHAQQALALATIIAAREADGASDEVLIPLVAGLAELQPWVRQWHAAVDPAFGVSPAEFTGQELERRARQVGRSLEQLAQWRPPAVTRGRKARS